MFDNVGGRVSVACLNLATTFGSSPGTGCNQVTEHYRTLCTQGWKPGAGQDNLKKLINLGGGGGRMRGVNGMGEGERNSTWILTSCQPEGDGVGGEINEKRKRDTDRGWDRQRQTERHWEREREPVARGSNGRICRVMYSDTYTTLLNTARMLNNINNE